MIIVSVSQDRMGCLCLDPVNKRIRKQCHKRIIENHREGSPEMHTDWRREDTERWLKSGSVAMIQRQDACESAIEDLRLSGSEIRDLSAGWAVRKLVDLDTFDHFFCYANGIPSDY